MYNVFSEMQMKVPIGYHYRTITINLKNIPGVLEQLSIFLFSKYFTFREYTFFPPAPGIIGGP